MIKCNVTVCGTVSQAASCRTNKEDNPIVCFAVNVVVPAKNGINKTIEVSVTKDGALDSVGSIAVGSRIEVTGVLVPKKRGDNMYWNLHANSFNLTPTADKDSVTGELEFRGKVGKKIEDRQDKKGNDFLMFSAYSAEKVQNGFEYIWVRFFSMNDSRDNRPWLQAGVRASIKGTLTLSVFNDRLDFSCRVSEMSEYVVTPF